MALPVPGDVRAESERRGLGALRSVHRPRRRIGPAVLWPVALVVAVATLVLSALGQRAVAAGLLAVVLLAAVGYRFVSPRVGRRLVAVYERGLVYAAGGRLVSAVWGEDVHVWREPGTADSFILVLESQADRAFGDGSDGPAEPIVLLVDGFEGQAELAAAVERGTQSRVSTGARPATCWRAEGSWFRPCSRSC